MPSSSNRVVIACAGSGKTTSLVKEALSCADGTSAIVTYTNNNTAEIKAKFRKQHGGGPKRVDVMSWFTILLRECVRPYQRSVYRKRRVNSINFVQGRSTKGVSQSNPEAFYFRNGDAIHSDKISRFTVECERNSCGLVTRRLSGIYDQLFIDEFQDLCGWDLNLLECFLRSAIRIRIVGDPRQCTYTTNKGHKNKPYRGIGILKLLREWERGKLCQIENESSNFRCNQTICDFADALWPDMPQTFSHNRRPTGHDGVFLVSQDDVHEYVRRFEAQVLRYNRNANTYGYAALKFGDSKGLEFDRVLIIPHGPIRKYLRTGDPKEVAGSLEKFYVAVTRAKHSVAFVYDEKCVAKCAQWKPK